MENNYNELIINICLVILGILLVLFSDQWVDPTYMPGISPSMFPKLAGFGMIITAGGYIIKNIKYWIKNTNESTRKISKNNTQYILLIMGVFLLYYFLVILIGFILATIISLFIYLRFNDEKKLLKLTITSIFTPLILYFIFQNIMKVQLPIGLLFN